MDRLRMRTTLLIPLLILSFGCTVLSLLVIRTIVDQQTQKDLASDLQHSVKTYRNFQHQQRELLARESALLADLPSLKSLMTTYDQRTIEDGGVEFWQVSGSDFFALLDQQGKLIVAYNHGPALDRSGVAKGLEVGLHRPEEPILLALSDRIYEISTQPLYFGPREHGTLLGFVAVGYSIDEHVARAVSEAAAAEVTFTVDGRVVVSTLSPELQQQLIARGGELLQLPTENRKIELGKVDYLAASERLTMSDGQEGAVQVPQLVVLKSFAGATQLVDRVNRWVLTLALLALVAGTGMLVSISRTLTRPIETLVGGTRALAQGNFDYQLSEDGAEEIRELSRAFERMRIQLRRTQKELLDSERLATIGRMASSISHDLRHYLSAMYANAEFMSDGNISQPEREELMLEVQTAVQGMTDLLESLLLFTQTGRALHPEFESIALMIQRAVSMVRSHPASRDVKVTLNGLSSLEAWVDSKKLGRAVCNLLLNACQAAKRGKGPPNVTLSLCEDERSIGIRIADNGPGVPASLRQKIFLPFVSEGRESGIGLGLTLAQQIAQEHGGRVDLDETSEGDTVFTINLPKASLQALGVVVERKTLPAYAPANGEGERMRDIRRELLACLILIAVQVSLHAQPQGSTPGPASSSTADAHSLELERKLEAISSALAVTHQQLEQSQQEMEQLREELAQIKKLLGSTQVGATEPSGPPSPVNAAKTTASAIESLQEQQQTVEAQVKVHDQTKVESSSKYPLNVTGLLLFNSFINRGSVDNIDLPEAAINNQNSTIGNGSAGATFRQTILGLQGYGPRIAGARTSADINLDFFAGLAYTSYATSAGTVRMRTASINIDWTNDLIQVGLVAPLISPLSPTSYAMVAEPALAGAGNLWTWAPQLRYAHQIPFQSGRRLQLELGVWDPPTAGYSTNELFRIPSPGEWSKQPGYESRVSYGTFTGEHPFQIGVSGYYSRQSYSGNQSVDSWAATTDWRVPLGPRFEVSGEGYRGRALGGLGGGVYKDVLFGIYAPTGLNAYRGLNAIGGWTQLKARFTESVEANASIGLDDGYARDFHEFIFPPTVTSPQLRARNKMVFGNVIFRPKTYLILSPEYRRIWTWPIYGTVNTADIFTLSIGYQF